MYTQCEKCKAIFHVNMREVTIAKGKLRCGECNEVFNATKTLSTTIPKTYDDLEREKKITLQAQEETVDPRDEDRMIHAKPSIKTIKKNKKQVNKLKWLIASTVLLSTLLLTQVLYNYRHLFLETPRNEPEKIQMLNHNVFAHPNESGALLISALIENTAEHAQPYPILELRLENAQSNLVAFRRFLPKEYLKNYSKGLLIPSKKPISLKLKIKDPGKDATRFQFKFL
ncbi:MAG: zinc-ribbon and DUF3426 domain-containing protein [Cocleimonas sp.]|nr:zinc-ribbon and DUF3426 domain-containing protein [Cocleimonas sp.]